MLLTSLTFALFVPVVFLLYWFAFSRSARLQNLLLVAASSVFYGWWDWRFLLLIGLNTITDFSIGVRLGRPLPQWSRRCLLGASLAVNLGLLGFFKYFNFFIGGLNGALAASGVHLQLRSLAILLPVAISFYTLQTMSYSIDVYKRTIEPTRDFLGFAAYILFFPKLLAGPIERAGRCLPQFLERRSFDPDGARDGMRQILWGVAKKSIVADACASTVSRLFAQPGAYAGSTLLLGAVIFAFQIYADFSGYSDIAIGLGRVFGVNLTRNFAYPYFARSIAEFWRRWHMSLSSWLRDYLFLPLSYALSRRLERDRYAGIPTGRLIGLIATLVTFLACGLWHGAHLTFVTWGLLYGVYLVPQVLRWSRGAGRAPSGPARIWPAVRDLGRMARTFLLVVIAWIFFRSDSLHQALAYLQGICSRSLFTVPQLGTGAVALIATLVAVEWLQRGRPYGLDLSGYQVPRPIRWLIYGALVVLIIVSSGAPQPFIYFRF